MPKFLLTSRLIIHNSLLRKYYTMAYPTAFTNHEQLHAQKAPTAYSIRCTVDSCSSYIISYQQSTNVPSSILTSCRSTEIKTQCPFERWRKVGTACLALCKGPGWGNRVLWNWSTSSKCTIVCTEYFLSLLYHKQTQMKSWDHVAIRLLSDLSIMKDSSGFD